MYNGAQITEKELGVWQPSSVYDGPPPGSVPPPVYVLSLPHMPPPPGLQHLQVAAGGGDDSGCGCCGCGRLLRPLRTPSEAARPVFRALASVALGLGILFLLSGGWCVLSSIFVIAQAGMWRTATATPAALDALVSEVKAPAASATGCCGRKRTAHLRSLATAAIVFGVMEMLLAVTLGWGLGASLGQALGRNFLTNSLNNIRICDISGACINNVVSATWRMTEANGRLRAAQQLSIYREGATGAAMCA
jgi:hypothetical protein